MNDYLPNDMSPIEMISALCILWFTAICFGILIFISLARWYEDIE